MSFTKLEECLADIKIWKKDLHSTPNEQLHTQVRDQLLHNVAPMLEALVKANMHELGETFEALDDMDAAIGELVGREGDFLQPEMASDLTATLVLGMFIVDLINGNNIQLSDELSNKKLQDATRLYRQQSTILIEQIKAVTVDDDDEEEDPDDDTDDGETDDLHGEGGDQNATGEVVAIGGAGGRGVPGGRGALGGLSAVGGGIGGGAGTGTGTGTETETETNPDSDEETGV